MQSIQFHAAINQFFQVFIPPFPLHLFLPHFSSYPPPEYFIFVFTDVALNQFVVFEASAPVQAQLGVQPGTVPQCSLLPAPVRTGCLEQTDISFCEGGGGSAKGLRVSDLALKMQAFNFFHIYVAVLLIIDRHLLETSAFTLLALRNSLTNHLRMVTAGSVVPSHDKDRIPSLVRRALVLSLSF